MNIVFAVLKTAHTFVAVTFQGLYPESHGIVENNMYDIEIDKGFYLGAAETRNPAWWSGEPV